MNLIKCTYLLTLPDNVTRICVMLTITLESVRLWTLEKNVCHIYLLHSQNVD